MFEYDASLTFKEEPTLMSRITNRSIARLAVSFSTAALVAVATALPSFADPQLTVGAGSQSTVGITFGAFGVTLNGSEQTPTTSFTFADIVDSRGSGAGWNLSLTLAQFTDVALDTLPLSSLIVKNTPIINKIDPTSSATGTITSLLIPGAALDTGAGQKLLSAAVAGGMGSYSISRVNLGMTLPATTKAGVYTSVATVSLNAAP